ncbi:MAG: hypothetical protein H6724_07680 [Sandaracinus sp.]|nr:hypothetical protein [Sandaracinus sp.]
MSLRRAAMLVLAWVAGCGASPRMLHQSEAYYEHCHAADLDPERSNDERIECWTAWLEHYREGMPPERVLHARRRLAGLEDGAAPDPLPDVTPAFSATFLALEAAPEATSGASDDATSDDATSDGATPDGATPDGATSDGATSDGATSDGAAAAPVAAEGAASPAGDEAGSPPAIAGVARVEAARPARDPAHRPPRPRPLSPRGSSPTHPCTPVCEPRWAACVDRAEGRGMDGLEACRMEHRICLQACM